MTLPIDAVLTDLIAALRVHGQAVLQAPPGAGKTTRVPLALLEAGLVRGRIVMLEPRRLATRASAERMAETLGERVGQTVGYRMRGAAKVGPGTRIEVVTEGILTRMIQSDPDLPGIGAVIFDEFHERSLAGDFGLALAREVRAVLRPDLILLPMSATLDAAPVADFLGHAPVVTAQGRAFPVEVDYLDTALPKGARLAAATADLTVSAATRTTGGILVFLPGAGEIRDCAARLKGRLPADCDIRPLFGAMPFAEQRAAIAPGPAGRRKVVLATAIAETSLTIEDVRVVVDAGSARRAAFDPGSGMSRLVTERATRAEATQRAGRAGRVAPGMCFRLWTRGQDGALAAFPPPEIATADLAPLALDLAVWGGDPAFLTPPPEAALTEARALLAGLGAVEDGRITEHGRAMAALPVHPRLAHMLLTAGSGAAPLAAILEARAPVRGDGADIADRLRALRGRDPALDPVRTEARRLARGLPDRGAVDPGPALALAYPDRIAMRRPGDEPRYLLSGGRGAVMHAADPLAGQPFLVAADLDGGGRDARIRLAAAITEDDIRDLFADRIKIVRTCTWSRRDGAVHARDTTRLGALSLSDRTWPDAPDATIAAAMCDGIREIGLGLSGKAALLRARVELVRDGGDAFPNMTDAGLLDTLEHWLAPFLGGVRTAADWRRFDPAPALRAMLDWERTQALDRAAPATWKSPLGRHIAIDYSGEAPEIALRLQEMFGTTTHPRVGRTPLRVTLLSPAGRPVQVTTDIPGFWATSYADVRRDMRGRYPRHPWPEDPTQATPTMRAKPRGT